MGRESSATNAIDGEHISPASVDTEDATIEQTAVRKVDEGEAAAENKDNSKEYHDRNDGGRIGREDVNHIDGMAQTATTIGSGGRGALLFVIGTLEGDATVHFSDLLVFNRYDASVTIINSETAKGADSRTYSPSGAQIKMSIDANTYNVTIFYITAAPQKN